jgi:SPP1 family predicted phage head-tail adaptor
MPSASDLRFKVRFDRQVETSDPAGGILTAWQTQFTRRADIKPMRGSEPVIAQRLTGVQPVLIIVRSDSLTRTIESSWRAVEMVDDQPVRYFALKTAEDMERERQFITMVAEAGTADGGTQA